mmetsp:Transcript_80314/g.210946  ORF Transcript_80314/g.210946 Transcript_80314/m.210946 type:complete len:225 (-) Transcript_80314:697-1371(-)
MIWRWCAPGRGPRAEPIVSATSVRLSETRATALSIRASKAACRASSWPSCSALLALLLVMLFGMMDDFGNCSPRSRPSGGFFAASQASEKLFWASWLSWFLSRLRNSSDRQSGSTSISAMAPVAPSSLPQSSSVFRFMQEGRMRASSMASLSPQPRPAHQSCSSAARARMKVSLYLAVTISRSSAKVKTLDLSSASKVSGLSGGLRFAWHSFASCPQLFQPIGT